MGWGPPWPAPVASRRGTQASIPCVDRAEQPSADADRIPGPPGRLQPVTLNNSVHLSALSVLICESRAPVRPGTRVRGGPGAGRSGGGWAGPWGHSCGPRGTGRLLKAASKGPKVHVQVLQTPAKCQPSRSRRCSGRASGWARAGSPPRIPAARGLAAFRPRRGPRQRPRAPLVARTGPARLPTRPRWTTEGPPGRPPLRAGLRGPACPAPAARRLPGAVVRPPGRARAPAGRGLQGPTGCAHRRPAPRPSSLPPPPARRLRRRRPRPPRAAPLPAPARGYLCQWRSAWRSPGCGRSRRGAA